MALLDTQNDGNQNTGDQNQGDQNTGDQTNQVPFWLENLEGAPQELKGNETLKRFKDIPSLANSYLELRNKMGENPLIMPNDQSSQEDWDNFYKSLGRPETPEAYQLTEVEGAERNAEIETAFRGEAHKLGLSQAQADGINTWVGDLAKKLQADEIKAYNERTNTAVAELKKEWGNSYDANLKLANAALKVHGGEEMEKLLSEAGLDNDPRVIKFFRKLGMETSEDRIKGAQADTAAGGRKVKYTRAQLETMMADPRYSDPMKRDPGYVKEIEDGFAALFPGDAIAAPTERGEGRDAITK